VALHMIWDGYRSVIVRTDKTDEFNAAAPAFLDISPEEVTKFKRGTKDEAPPVEVPAP
jgi:hypothetical protein